MIKTDGSTYDDEDTALYNSLKDLPDFQCLPLPVHWFKKFGIVPLEVENTRAYLKDQYTFKKQFEQKDLPPLIIDSPQRDKDGNIKLVDVAPPEDVKVEVVQRPYEHDPTKTLVVLPSLKDDNFDESGNYVRPYNLSSSALPTS